MDSQTKVKPGLFFQFVKSHIDHIRWDYVALSFPRICFQDIVLTRLVMLLKRLMFQNNRRVYHPGGIYYLVSAENF